MQLSRQHCAASPEGRLTGAAGRWLRHVESNSSSVQRIWSAHGLQPHRTKTFLKLSTDPHFREKLTDVVGLYLNPPDKAIVLCVDEKSQFRRWIAPSRDFPSSVGDAVR